MNPSDLVKLQSKFPLSKSTLARNLPPSVTTDTATELGPTTACADQPGRACGSNSKERAAANSLEELAWEIYENQTGCPLSHPKPECDKAEALGGTIQRETESVPGIAVRFTGYRVKPLDPDNFAGSIKDLLDGLRHAGIIPGDEPWRITLETNQVKVNHFKDERTEIEVTV